MQDITPPYKRPRGQIKPGQRPAGFEMRPPTVYREVYSRTKIINSTTVYVKQPIYKEEVVQEQIKTSLPLSLQHELESLLADSYDTDITVVEGIESYDRTSILTPEKEMLLKKVRNIIREERERSKFKILFSKRNILTAMAILFVSTTGYVAVDTWTTNNTVKAVTAKLSSNTNTTDEVSGKTVQSQEGTDEAQPTHTAIANYSVAPSLPKKLYIDKLHIAARVLPMSVNPNGSVQAPRNIFDAGWYNGSVKPGEVGAMFVDGHASGALREGLFAYLDKLVVGDTLQVEKGDGAKLTYKVVHTEIQPVEGLDMKKMLLPYGNALRGLNMMTCTGKWVDATNSYDKRILVWTEQV